MEQETMEDTMDDTMEQELNIQNMADAFQAIATEIAKPNLQNTMADTFQTIATEIGNSNLQNMAGAFQTLATEIVNIPNTANNNIPQLFQDLHQQMVILGNSSIRDRHTDIEALLTDTGAIPPNYPVDVEALGTPRLIKLMDYSLLIACQ
ncbi:hypothetical protein RhiirA1_537779 [Rhizophagus irregularis]|uniref:Uncharacterized protein n=2 Tax=Rhizophagus irregularis TaxID=588596 RepID=A0A2N0RJD9_9GLOM|nr:hypothetical protein GLOIN_2v1763256 [Rhizophagus irregularis DAOM 181602=DAOM 197198]PKC63412.1 hypothetical protein RhiirA1_537779 [Rhizophagus irregularis]POG81360.1 hypothetical protein GLOIN_2v1763256 [Rhizophagus irregularis DAOM 181602=DAOM 197198]|eukprot:XP_025188226.1 hypothetical protein GLOIN_2v1763256 [Rhizophagus irregularis DAOM 181602=DAOM 197198]